IITPRTTTTPIITPRTTPTCTATKPTCPNNVAPVCTGITWSCPSVGPAGTWACGGGTGVEPAIGTQCINGGDTYQGKCAVYHCPNGCAGSTCGETSPNVRIEFVSCSSASLASGECGQIDTVTNANRYCQPQSGCDVKAINCSGSCASGTPVTPPTAPQCINNIVAYKNGNALSPSELAALQPNDVITLAFAPGGAATKVRFRVNSSSDADWWETTTRHPNNNAQFMLNYSLANTTSFTIEAQWFDGTAWH
ncbi:MAG: hypothetical protein NTY06_03165, partial [Candidatus Gottesmanbacteria bacterium]|nr:hypothetical protein [Candidatus Gottesmanbacteria bacterium]